MDLAEMLSERRGRIMQRWTEKVRGSLHPETMARLELIDQLPQFLDEIAGAIRRFSTPDGSTTAAEHGVQRLTLGFNLDGVVREYGALRDAIVEVALLEHVTISAAEQQLLFDCVINGIAAAVSEYARERDAELHRQANEHFAFIAHELRNPLGTSLIALTTLQRRGKLPDDRTSQALQRGLLRLNELVESTLRVAQVAAGLTLQCAPVSLRKLIDDAELSASAAADGKEVRIAHECDADVQLVVDERLVSSALTNLVSNAVKFTRAGGKVDVRAKVSDSRVTIEVEDCCGGLPPGSVEKAFTPFAQMGSDRSGFGLGLAIAKQAADAHGGSIRIQDLPGKGCIFVLELPLRPFEAASARP